ncbi:MAG: ELWxxDGT repeat protein [Pirellulales bacterium]
MSPSAAKRLRLDPLESRLLLAADISLLKDLNSQPLDLEPEFFGVAGDYAYFSASDKAHGRELWRTDGTSEGTLLVRDIRPGPQGSNPNGNVFMPVADRAYFRAWDSSGADGLWVTDGTSEGTKLLSDTAPTQGGWAFFQGRLYYEAGSNEIWSTDGTPAGTAPWTGLDGSGLKYVNSGIRVLGGSLVFSAWSEQSGYHLMKSDGTAAGTSALVDGRAGLQTNASQVIDDKLYFFAEAEGGQRLWTTDGTIAGTQPVSTAIFGSVMESATVGNKLFFTEGTPSAQLDLWVSDGTAAGTQQLPAGNYPTRLAASSTRVFFDAGSDQFGREPWTSDGTAAGTSVVKDVRTGLDDSLSWNGPPGFAVTLGDEYYFVANDGGGSKLWRSDGTEAGTQKVSDQTDAVSWRYGNLNGRLVFDGSLAGHGEELWISDGTPAGTNPVTADLSESAVPSPFIAAGARAYFTADDGVHGQELWVTDGTTNGTHMVKDIFAGPSDSVVPFSPQLPQYYAVIGDTLFFYAFDPGHGWEPWKTDGTEAGTVMLADAWPGPEDDIPDDVGNFTKLGDYIYFRSRGPQGWQSIWQTDGTSAGTHLYIENVASMAFRAFGDQLYWVAGGTLHAIDGVTPQAAAPIFGAPVSAQGFLTSALGKLFFRGRSNAEGSELWVTDGTVAGTQLVKDINPGQANSTPGYLTAFGDALYFLVTEGTERGLWKTDGTEQGTSKLAATSGSTGLLRREGNNLVFVVGTHLWKSDGTQAGTMPLQQGAEAFVPNSAVSLDDTLYFVGDDGQGTVRLWQQTGNTPKAAVFLPENLGNLTGIGVVAGKLVLFTDNAAGELWSLALNPSLAGDANGDGRVDLTDFGILKANFGTGTTRAEGDFDGNGQVDLSDFGILKAEFGAGGTSGSTVVAAVQALDSAWAALGLAMDAEEAKGSSGVR